MIDEKGRNANKWGTETKCFISDDSTNYAPTFYSKLPQVLSTYKGEKVAAQGLESYLKARGVKPEELKWSGIADYVEGKKSIPKDELMQFVKDNDLETKEVKHTETQPPRDSFYDSREEAASQLYVMGDMFGEPTVITAPRASGGDPVIIWQPIVPDECSPRERCMLQVYDHGRIMNEHTLIRVVLLFMLYFI